MCKKIFTIFLFTLIFWEQQSQNIDQSNRNINNTPPNISATGLQMYCPQSHLKIVTDFQIIDPDDIGALAIYIQITSGYVLGQDILVLSGTHPNIQTQWSTTEGKLKIFGVGNVEVPYIDLIAAVKDVEFYNTSATPSGYRDFSISIGNANYLPSNGHYYIYYQQLGITWTDAKIAAEATTYFGMHGYLATVTSADEAQIVGAQASGAGWIGGSDSETEGVWKWMTGPENGNYFTYTYWNSGEPNNLFDEDYAHVTAPGVGILGSWNDLRNTGDPSGDYQPKGYIVEYGGMPNDPIINIATSTRIIIPEILSTTPVTHCGVSSVVLEATSSIGNVIWYESPISNVVIHTGNTFTTPVLSSPTTYYVQAGCSTVKVPITANVGLMPYVNYIDSNVSTCFQEPITLQANASSGNIYWYDSSTSSQVLHIGNEYTVYDLTASKIFYVEAINNGCTNGTRRAITVHVNFYPIVEDENVTLCEGQSIVLNAEMSDVSYVWDNGSTNSSISVSNPGNYQVGLTNIYGCSSLKTFHVIQRQIPIINNIMVQDQTVEIQLNNPQDYFLYSIDGENFQTSPVFNVVEGGIYNAYVKDVDQCSLVTKEFFVFSIPNFFTPNGDSYNDFWEIKSLDYKFPNAQIKIFNRFGKLISNFKAGEMGWDGNYNGLPLPSSDYWYLIELEPNSKEIRGHFTLKR